MNASHPLVRLFRLPIDIVFLTIDLFRLVVSGFLRRYLPGEPPCPFCYSTVTSDGRRACRFVAKYGNPRLFKLICPDIDLRVREGDDFPQCDRYNVLGFHFRHAVVAAFLTALWGGAALSIVYARRAYGPADAARAIPRAADAAELRMETGGTELRDPVAATQRLQRAVGYFEAGDVEAARIEALGARKLDPDNPNVRLQLGICERELGDLIVAQREFDHALRLQPDLADAVAALAELADDTGQTALAIQSFWHLLELRPDTAETHFRLARLHLRQRRGAAMNRAEARLRLVDAVRLAAGDGDVLLGCAGLYVMLGEANTAEELYRGVNAADPERVDGRLALAAMLRAQGRIAEAETLLDQIAPTGPEPLDWRIQRAELDLAKGDVAAAVAAYRRIVAADPDHAVARARLAETLIKHGDRDEGFRLASQLMENFASSAQVAGGFVLGRMYLDQKLATPAIDTARKILAVGGENTEARMIIVRGLVLQREHAAALDEIGRVLAVDEEHFEAQLLRATTLIASGEDDAGLDALARLSERLPNAMQPEFSLAVYHHGRRQVETARDHYEEALRRAPGHPVIVNNLAMLLMEDGGDLERAHELARDLHERFPENPLALDTYGWTLYRRDAVAAALPYLREAAQRAPRQPEVRYHHGVVAHALGDRQTARAELQAALDLSDQFPGIRHARELLGPK